MDKDWIITGKELKLISEFINERYNLDTWVNEQTRTIWLSVWNKELTDSYDIEMSKEQTKQFYTNYEDWVKERYSKIESYNEKN